jgi:hypothetical protein
MRFLARQNSQRLLATVTPKALPTKTTLSHAQFGGQDCAVAWTHSSMLNGEPHEARYFCPSAASIGKTHQDVDICLSVSWRAQPALRVGVGSE